MKQKNKCKCDVRQTFSTSRYTNIVIYFYFLDRGYKMKFATLGLALVLLFGSQATCADINKTYAALKLLSNETLEINKILNQHERFAPIIENEQRRDVMLTLTSTAGIEREGVEIIVQRATPNSLQYQRITGKALPFFVIVRNLSPHAVTFKPSDVRLRVNQQELKPMNNRNLQTLLKHTNRKDFSFAEGIERMRTVMDAGSTLVSMTSGMGVIKNVSGAMSGGDISSAVSNSSFNKLYTMIESDLANEFRAGDETLLHLDEVNLRSHSMTVFNVFFKEATLNDADMQLNVYLKGQAPFQYKFMAPTHESFK